MKEKVKIIDRLILTMLSLCLAVFSVILVLFPFEGIDFLSVDNIYSILNFMKGEYLYSAIGLILLAISVRILIIGITWDREKSRVMYIVQRTDYGEINISSDTIIGLVQSVSNNFTGVSNIKTKVDIIEGQLFIDLIGEVSPEINIPDSTRELQNKVKEHVESCTGVNVNEIKVMIKNVIAPIRNVK